jgi:hypothetical protein
MTQWLSHGISNYKLGIGKRKKMVEGAFENLEKTVNNYL